MKKLTIFAYLVLGGVLFQITLLLGCFGAIDILHANGIECGLHYNRYYREIGANFRGFLISNNRLPNNK